MNTKPSSKFPKTDLSATERKIIDDSLLDTDPHDLEDHIKSLKKLDELRIKSAKLRDQGVALLKEWFTLAPANETHPPIDPKLLPWSDLERDTFIVSTLERHYDDHKEPRVEHDGPVGDRLIEQLMRHLSATPKLSDETIQEKLAESAKKVSSPLFQLIRHLSATPNLSDDTIQEKLAESDEKVRFSYLLFHLQLNSTPVIFAAELLQVLVTAPNSAYSKEALLCYYWIVRELFTADAPDWSVGGARAASGGRVSAYTTAQCVHAIRAFAQAQENTARFIDHVLRFKRSSWLLTKKMPVSLERWAEAEQKRLAYSCYVTLQRYSDARALRFREPESHTSVREDVKAILESLPTIVDDTITAFEDARGEAGGFRIVEEEALKHVKKDKQDEAKKRFERSQYGHDRAWWALDQGLRNAQDIKNLFGQKTHVDILRAISKTLKTAQERVRKMLQPTENYLSSVLDRELSAASFGNNSSSDPNEMAFAAESLGTLRPEWRSDERLGEAVRYLSHAISNDGRFPIVRPYHRRNNAIVVVDSGSVIQPFAELVRYAYAVGLNEPLVQKMLCFFDETRVNKSGIEDKDEEKDIWHDGWFREFAPEPQRFDPWATAVAVRTLGSINGMLDERINHLILEHFTVKRPGRDLDMGLDDLFYPDYGLDLTIDRPTAEEFEEGENVSASDTFKDGEWLQSFARKDSVAITLQRMRAHITRVSVPTEFGNCPCSLVFHGPPGTGKTTLVEALAKSCEVPLVEVTPSDIVIGGEEAIERRARAVFEALSFLTRVVILFDEFDPVLWRRDPNASTARSVFTFLTPGMLPKLKALHKSAKERSVGYVLSTNLIGGLDEAAVREGRFDEKIGIYPPDALSRAGRLLSQAYVLLDRIQEEEGQVQPIPELSERVLNVVRKTHGGAMDSLGKPSWFTAPSPRLKKGAKYKNLDALRKDIAKDVRNNTPFSYLFCDGPLEAIVPTREAHLGEVVASVAIAIKEYVQWWWIAQWDEKLCVVPDKPNDDPLVEIEAKRLNVTVDKDDGERYKKLKQNKTLQAAKLACE